MMQGLNIIAVMLAVSATFGCKAKPSLDVGPANALVPAKYKYKLRFEPRVVTSHGPPAATYVVPVPKTWTSDDSGTSKSMDLDANGNSSLSLWAEPCSSALCDLDVEHAVRYLNVVSDTRSEHGRHVIEAIAGPSPWHHAMVVSVSWWEPGQAMFHICEAELSADKLGEAVDAFAKACELVEVRD